MKLTLGHTLRLSEIFEKLNFNIEDIKELNGSREEMVGRLIFLVLSRMHKANNEIIALISDITGKTENEVINLELNALMTLLNKTMAGNTDFFQRPTA